MRDKASANTHITYLQIINKVCMPKRGYMEQEKLFLDFFFLYKFVIEKKKVKSIEFFFSGI